jgi:hypothetical protein
MLLLVAIGMLPGVAAGQGLGGAAREEAQRRESQRTADGEVRTYSNTDLRSDPDEAAGSTLAVTGSDPAATDAAPEASDPVSPDAADRDDADLVRERLDRAAARRKKQEQQWRARAAAARATLDAARQEHDAVCKTGGFYVSGG